jgi:hypothetical protein
MPAALARIEQIDRRTVLDPVVMALLRLYCRIFNHSRSSSLILRSISLTTTGSVSSKYRVMMFNRSCQHASL